MMKKVISVSALCLLGFLICVVPNKADGTMYSVMDLLFLHTARFEDYNLSHISIRNTVWFIVFYIQLFRFGSRTFLDSPSYCSLVLYRKGIARTIFTEIMQICKRLAAAILIFTGTLTVIMIMGQFGASKEVICLAMLYYLKVICFTLLLCLMMTGFSIIGKQETGILIAYALILVFTVTDLFSRTGTISYTGNAGKESKWIILFVMLDLVESFFWIRRIREGV